MKTAFIDPATGALTSWGYVVANGADIPLSVPDDFALDPGTVRYSSGQWQPIETTLQVTQSAKVATMTAAYRTAAMQPVVYLGTTFQCDEDSRALLAQTLVAFAGTAPAGFYWLDANNTPASMTFAQLQGLAQAIAAQVWAAFQRLQARKAAITSATTADGVNAIVW